MKKISKLLVIMAAASAMILVGCSNASGGGGGGGGGGGAPAVSTEADLLALGAYTDSAGTLSFDDDKTGSYTTSSPNMRAASAIPNFTWEATETNGSVKIVITYTVSGATKTGTLTLSNGKISGKLDDSDESSAVTDMSLGLPTETDVRGTTWKLSYPSQSEMDRMLRSESIDWYPTSVSFASTGNTGTARVRYYDGRSIGEDDFDGTWSIGSSGDQAGYIILSGEEIAASLIKLNTDKTAAYVLDPYAGAMKYVKQR